MKYLFKTKNVPGAVQVTWDTLVNKTEKAPVEIIF